MEFDNVRSDLLRMDPFPNVELGFAYIFHEAQQVTMMKPAVSGFGVGMASKNPRPFFKPNPMMKVPIVLTVGIRKHTRETCFKLNGYPDCWEHLKARKATQGKSPAKPGRAAMSIAVTATDGHDIQTSMNNVASFPSLSLSFLPKVHPSEDGLGNKGHAHSLQILVMIHYMYKLDY